MIIIVPDEKDTLKQNLMAHIKDIIAQKQKLENELIGLKYSINLSMAIFYDLFGKEYGSLAHLDKETNTLTFPTAKEKLCVAGITKKIRSYECLKIELEAVDKSIGQLEERYRLNFGRSFFRYRV